MPLFISNDHRHSIIVVNDAYPAEKHKSDQIFSGGSFSCMKTTLNQIKLVNHLRLVSYVLFNVEFAGNDYKSKF